MSELLRSKHAFGDISGVDTAIAENKIDAYDILFLTTPTGHAIGWIDKDGNKVIIPENKSNSQVIVVDELPKTGEEGIIYVFGNDGYIWNGSEFVNMCKPTDLTELEAAIEKKADADEVDAKIEEVETALTDVKNAAYSHEKIKYEITDVPLGTIVNYRENEIRIMCPSDAVFTKQAVGAGGDANSYYCTFKTYAPDNAVGYIEHLGDQVDGEILVDLKTDMYGRRYQPSWLALAKYDESTDTWAYYGANSNVQKFIGWDYQIDWFNADGVMIASDSIRINLSNENCHHSSEPYYVSNIMKEVDTRIEEIEAAYTVVEF